MSLVSQAGSAGPLKTRLKPARQPATRALGAEYVPAAAAVVPAREECEGHGAVAAQHAHVVAHPPALFCRHESQRVGGFVYEYVSRRQDFIQLFSLVAIA